MRARRVWGPIVAATALFAVAASVFFSGVASAGVIPVSISATRPESPAVSGSRLVWADRRAGHYDIYEYDAVTRSTRRLTTDAADHIQPSMSGDLVVWADYRNGDADIYGYDLSTGTERPLVVAPGDQIAPSVSSRWLVWEDRSTGYSGSVKALDLSQPAAPITSVASYSRRPAVAGDLVVWEGTSQSAPDVKAMNLATGARYDVATSSYAEQLPATDGRYVAWAQDNGTDLDVKGFDTQTSRYFTCGGGAGEQSFPEVGNGVVYWIDNVGGQRLHADTYDVGSGRTARFNDYGTEDVAAVSASSGDVAWLAKAGSAWQLRATFATGELAASALSRLVPSSAPTVRLAQLSADPTPPEVVSASVERGARNVRRDSSFSLRFSEALDPSSVTAKSVRLMDSRGRPVRSRLRYSALAKAVTVTPNSPLGSGTYTLAVTPSVADPSGNTLSDPLTISFSTIDLLADTTPPSTPGSLVTSVYQGNQVQLSWSAASDDVAVNGYLVYRSLSAGTPIQNFPVDASFVTSTTATNAIVSLAANEKANSFEYYYVVVARDSSMNTSTPSYNDAPDPHGTFTSGRSTNLCMRCHSVHGNAPTMALGAKSASACYVCHGGTAATGAYGAKSSMDVQADFRDDAVISSAGPEVVGRGSIHRNSYMATIQRECDACHTPHKKPYDSVAANSYNRLLRTQLSTNPAGYRYNTDASAIGNQFCADCHGASATNIAIVGGSTAYSASGGNHLTNYASSAHATGSVPVNPGDTNPSIQCEACHNNHASSTNKLVDYRGSNATTTANSQSGLCFKCHSVSGLEAGKPNTWNGRDVKTEFARASHHPFTAGTAEKIPQTNQAVFSQTLLADFVTDTRFQTSLNNADGDGAAVLATHTVTANPPSGPYLFYAGATPRFDSLNASQSSSTWNADFTPANITVPGTGANATVKNGVVFALQAGGSATIRTYTPPAGTGTGTWGTTGTGLWQNANAGSDMAYDSTDGYIWTLIGGYTPTAGNTNIRRTTAFTGTTLQWYTPNNYNGPEFRVGGTDQRLGAGSTLAWVPANGTRTERLYVVNRDGTNTRDGQLYYYNTPDAATGGTNWSSTTHVLGSTGTASDVGSRMVYFRIGANDYLYFIRGGANADYLIQLANTTAAAGTVLDNGTANPWGANVAEGANLVWNGDTTQAGFRLFAINGNSNVMKVATWNGSALVWSDGPALQSASAAGSWLTYANADPAASTSTPYWYSGTLTSPNISVAGTLTKWRTLTFTSQAAAGTAFAVRIQGSTNGGSTWSDVATATSSPFDLSSAVPANYTTIRLVAQLTGTGSTTPRLDDWQVTADYDQSQSGSYVDTPDNTFMQADQGGFSSDPSYHTQVTLDDGDGSVVLDTHTAQLAPNYSNYLYFMDSNALTMDEYNPADGSSGAWNTAFTPTSDAGQFNSASGSVLFSANGKVYRTRGGNSATSPQIRGYTPPAGTGAGTWGNAAIATFSGGAFSTGAQSTLNPGSSVVYISRGGGTAGINWWQCSGTNQNSMNFYPGGVAGALGAGSGVAYAPASDRLWVVNRNGGAGNGILYFLGAPGVKTGNQTFTSTGVQVTSSGTTTYYGRLASFKTATGTADFLAYIGFNSANGTDTVVMSNLTGTPMKVNLGKKPFGDSRVLGDGCDLIWDGVPGGYLYAVQGGTNPLVARVQIPDDPTDPANWGGWTRMTDLSGNAAAGSALAMATTKPAPYSGPAYWSFGTIESPEINAPNRLTRWGTLTYTAQTPANTSFSVKVQGSADGGNSWSDVATADSSPYDLGGISTAYKTLRLVGQLSSQFITLVSNVFSQDVLTEYSGDSLSNTVINTADGEGAAILATHTAMLAPRADSYMYYMRPNSLNVDEYNPNDLAGTWDTAFTPPADTGQFNSASGSTIFTAGDKVYRTRGGNSATSPQIRAFTPPLGSGTGSWGNARIATFSGGAFNTGAQSTVNSGSSVVYISRGGGNAGINWWQYSGTTQNSMNFYPAGVAGALGAGSGLAYTASPDRLWAVNRNAGAGNGDLYYLGAPGVKTGNQTFTDTGVQVTSNGATSYYGRLEGFKNAAGTEFLAYAGVNSAGTNDTVVLFNLGATPAKLNLGQAPFAGALADGCDLVWDGVPGGYLYAIQGGTTAIARIAIPDDPTLLGAWDTWTPVNNLPAASAAGAGLAFAVTQPAPYNGPAFWTAGTIQSTNIAAPAGLTRWGSLNYSAETPTGTSFTVKVQGSTDGGASWSDLATATSSPYDLGGISTSNTTLRLVGQFTSQFITLVSNVFSQETLTEFNPDGRNNTVLSTVDGDGAAILATHTATLVPVSESYMYYMRSNSLNMDEYDAHDLLPTWGAAFTPTPDTGQFNSATGSTMFTANGRVYRTRGGNSATAPQIRAYTPPAGTGTGTWGNAAITTFSGGAFSTGAQATVNSGSSVAYISRGGGGSTINWWQYSGATQGSMNFYTSAFQAGALGAGSGVAYTASPDRLWAINRNGGAGNGDLYYLGAPGVKTNNQTFTDTGVQVTSNGATSYYGRLENFKNTAGTDFLAYTGANTAGTADTVILYNLATTPAAMALGQAPFAGALADGCDLVWDGVPGGYLYAIQGGTTAIARIAIPDDPTQASSWDAWTPVTNLPAASGVGSGLAFVVTQPAPYNGAAFWNSGTITSSNIVAPGSLSKWGTLTYESQVPTETTLSVKIQGSTNGGASWSDVATATSSPYDLSSVSTAYKTLRLVGQFASKFISITSNAFFQDTLAEFGPDSKSNTVLDTSDGNGAAVLATHTATMVPPSGNYLYFIRGGLLNLDAYSPADGASGNWNGVFAPKPDTGQFNSATGSTLFTVNGVVYRTRGGNSATSPQIRAYTPPSGSGTGTWGNAGITTFSGGAFGTGSQAAVNGGGSVVYISRGGSSSTINWWQYPTPNEGSMTFYPGNTRTLGVGSGVAFTSTPNRLWVVNRDGTNTNGNGNLYYLNNPGTLTGQPTFQSSGVQVTTNNATSYYGRLASFKNAQGTEFLAYVGVDTNQANNTVVVYNLGTTPAKVNLGEAPFAGALADGCDLVWDGVPGGYLYAIRGGADASVARIQIPADPTVAANWGSWTPLTNLPANAAAGSNIAFAQTQPGPYVGTSYWATGTITSSNIAAPAQFSGWSTLTYDADVSSDQTVSVKVQGSTNGGASWSDLTTAGASPLDLSWVSPTYRTLRLVGQLGSQYMTGTATPFSQTVQAEFGLDTPFQTTTNMSDPDGDGAVVLQTHTVTINPSAQPFLFAHDGNSTAFDAYDPGADSWNTVSNAWNPTDYQNGAGTPGTGASAYAANGKVYVTQGGGTANQWAYTPPPVGAGGGTWAAAQVLPATVGAGSSSAVNTRTGENYVYVSRGAGNNTIMWWQFTGATTNSMTFSGGSLGYGSALAFAPTANRLFVINRNSGAGDGRLYYLASPQNKTGAQTFTQGPAVVDGGTTARYNAMCYFSVGGAEYLAIIGRDSGGTNNNLIVVSNLTAASPTVTNVGKYPFAAAAADGVSLEWGNDGYLYAIHGGATNEFERIAIPSNPTVAGNWTGNWTTLAQAPFTSFDAGSVLAFQNATPPRYSGTAYWNAGSMTSPNITPPGTVTKWDWLNFTPIVPAGTAVDVKIQGSPTGGAPWTDLATAVSSPYDLSAIPASYSYLRLVGELTSTDGAATPILCDWSVSADFKETTAALSTPSLNNWAVTSRFDETTASADTAILESWSVTASSDETDAAKDTAILDKWSVTANFDETDSAVVTPRLDDWSVTSNYGVFQQSGSLSCVSCHNAHGVQKGTAGAAWQIARTSAPTNTIGTSGNTTDFCLGCHTRMADQPSFGLDTAKIVPYAVSFRDSSLWPFDGGWDKSYGSLGFKNSGHFTTTGNKALCENCHDPHGSNNANLVAWTRPASFAGGIAATRDNTSTNAAESNLCFECHGKSTVTIGGFAGRTASGTVGVNMDAATGFSQAYSHPTTATGIHNDKETATNLGAGRRHAECVDCHDPHAAQNGIHTQSSSAGGSVLKGAYGVKPTWGDTTMMSGPTAYAPIRMDGTTNEAYLCFKCHSSNVNLVGVKSPSGGFQETNIAAEFNPANESGHNVLGADAVWPKTSGLGPSKNLTWTWNTGVLKAPWSTSMRVTCSDCHTYSASGARGPHGSNVAFMLDSAWPGNYQTATLDSNSTIICSKCHQNYRNMNDVHGTGDHGGSDGRCIACHIKVPHGWKRPRLLGYTTDPEPYRSLNLTGITLTSYTYNNWPKSNCGQTGCGEHSGSPSGTKWP